MSVESYAYPFAKRSTPSPCYFRDDCRSSLIRPHSKWKVPSRINYLEQVLELHMGWIFLVLAASYFVTWTFFAACWWLLCLARGDFDKNRTTGGEPCLSDIHDFVSVYLFSVETQHTIGYGIRYINDTCTPGLVLLMIQCVTGVIVECLTCGLLFAKLCYPKKRESAVLFTREAVINRRNGRLYLMFRVADTGETPLIDTTVRAEVYTSKVSREGEVIPFYPTSLLLQKNESGTAEQCLKIFLQIPQLLLHPLTPDSPLYESAMREEGIARERFEIILMVHGYSKPTGIPIQIHKSYLPSDVLWAHRFTNMMVHRETLGGEERMDLERFDQTYPTTMSMEDVGQQGAKAYVKDDPIGKDGRILYDNLEENLRVLKGMQEQLRQMQTLMINLPA